MSGQLWPTPGQFRSRLAVLESNLAEIGPMSGRFQANVGRVRANFGRFWSFQRRRGVSSESFWVVPRPIWDIVRGVPQPWCHGRVVSCALTTICALAPCFARTQALSAKFGAPSSERPSKLQTSGRSSATSRSTSSGTELTAQRFLVRRRASMLVNEEHAPARCRSSRGARTRH